MSELRNRMIMDMELRAYSPLTIKHYVWNVAKFAKYFGKSPELLGEDEIREYLHHCITERHLSESSANYIYSSLKFFYTKTLGRGWNVEYIARAKERKKLPVILSKSEVKSILDDSFCAEGTA
jgi:site-specific recombinase XerD